MKINPKLLIGLALLLIFGYFLQDLVFGNDQYAAAVKKARTEKNDAFRRGNTSPLLTAQRATFDSLRYFAPDKAYRFTAKWEPFAEHDTVLISLTNGEAEKYLRWGRASFTIDNQPQQLACLLKADGKDTTLFVPFTDKTNGFDTYGGGRYLDAPKPKPNDQEITLDFNAAYNPYCAYNSDYACPVPPADNRLQVAIKAGEKSFHD